MKKLLTLVVLVAMALQLNGQITLTIADCTLNPPDTIFRKQIKNPGSVPDPTLGPNQYWDYSNIEIDPGAATLSLPFAPGTIPAFPTATATATDNLNTVLPGLFLETRSYHRNDASGKAVLGRVTSDFYFPLVAFTGNPSDNLTFLESTSVFEEPNYDLKYPAYYGRQWDADITISSDWLTTIAIFSLNGVPSSNPTYFHLEKEIVGWGTLKLPNFNGGDPYEVDALLLKELETLVDSFFVGGQPAPPEFLGPFGLTQGAVRNDTNYRFYIKGLNSEVLNIERQSGGVSQVLLSNDVFTGDFPPAYIPVPTMGEWGLFIFGLLICTLGVVFLYNKSRTTSLSKR